MSLIKNKCYICKKESNYHDFLSACWKHTKNKKFIVMNKKIQNLYKIRNLFILHIDKELNKIKKIIING